MQCILTPTITQPHNHIAPQSHIPTNTHHHNIQPHNYSHTITPHPIHTHIYIYMRNIILLSKFSRIYDITNEDNKKGDIFGM